MTKSNERKSAADREIDFGYSHVRESEKEERVREVFDSVARKYDLMNDLLSFGMHMLIW